MSINEESSYLSTGDDVDRSAREFVSKRYPLISVERVDAVIAEGGHWATDDIDWTLYDEHGDIIALLSAIDESAGEVDNYLFVKPLPRPGRRPSWAR